MTFATKTRRAAILTNLLFSLPLTAGLLRSAIPATAQTSLKVDIPFAFSANNQNLPAGSYWLQRQSDYFLAIRNVKTASTIVVMIHPEQAGALESHSRLIFDREGDHSYLSQVWTPDTNRYSKLKVRRQRDQELRTQVHPASSTVEVAAK
jgi:hypothetical protein